MSCFTREQVKRVSAHCAVVCHRNGRVHRSPPAVGIRYRTGPPCFFFPLLDVRLESRLRDAVRSRRTFSKISFENAGAACATDRDKTNAPSISQCKLIAGSRNVLRSPVSAIEPCSAISPAAKPDTSKPYVMWPDTPYEHLMIPVR